MNVVHKVALKVKYLYYSLVLYLIKLEALQSFYFNSLNGLLNYHYLVSLKKK